MKQLPSPNAASPPSSSDTSSRQGRRRWLTLARGAWIGCALLLLANFVASIPAYDQILRTVCTLPNRVPCHMPGLQANPSKQLTPDQVAALARLHLSLATYANLVVTVYVVLSLLYWGVGLLLFWRKSDEGMGLFVSLLLILFGGTGIFEYFLGAYVPTPTPLFLQILLNLITGVQWIGFFAFLVTFPTGRFVPRWSWLLIPLPILSFLGLNPGLFPDWAPVLNTPVVSAAAFLLTIGGPLALMMVYRYRRVLTAVQRQQAKWFLYAVTANLTLSVILLGGVLPAMMPGDSPFQLLSTPVGSFALAFLPLGLLIAILRYRLWDIDLLINRTLVYGLLTALVAGVYVLVVGVLGTLLHTFGNVLISLLATGLVAVLFQPLRARLQRLVNRLMYGERDDPSAVLSRLAGRLEATLAPETAFATIVETVAQALKLPYVAITLKQRDTFSIVAFYGRSQGKPFILPLVYQAETIGQLQLAPRGKSETFTPADRTLLEAIASHAGIAAHAVQLTTDLQRSREYLVTAREEERRRLRRDLHDGLGPTLASMTLKLDAARLLLTQNPVALDSLLVELKAQTQTTIADIRRLVYGLRPPALDEFGLVSALREQAAHYSQLNGVPISIEAPTCLPTLPAAVEVAIYRIVLEALTNVTRHAQAHACWIRLLLSDVLSLEVRDDGLGLPPTHHTGVGLASMRERAAELGGTCVIESGVTGGTHILVQLPLGKE